MPPELLSTVMNWGPVAAILFGILYRADQIARALVPVIVDHFKHLAEALDAMKVGLSALEKVAGGLERLTGRVDELGGTQGLAAIAADAKHAAEGVEELLIRIPAREKESA